MARAAQRKEQPVTPSPFNAVELFSSVDRYTAPASARGTLQTWVFGITLSGSVLHDADTRRLPARAGDCVLVRPHHPQYWRVPTENEGHLGRWKVIYATFTPRQHWYPWLQAISDESLTVFRCSEPKARKSIARCLQRVLAHSRSSHPHKIEFAMHALERALLLCWRDRLRKAGSTGLDERIRKAVDLIGRDPTRSLKLEQLARQCHLSRSHFAALFKTQVGTSPLQYQERRRIEEAQRMLRMSFESVRQIAYACGFEDARYFSTRFKNRTGLTPREFRKRARLNAR